MRVSGKDIEENEMEKVLPESWELYFEVAVLFFAGYHIAYLFKNFSRLLERKSWVWVSCWCSDIFNRFRWNMQSKKYEREKAKQKRLVLRRTKNRVHKTKGDRKVKVHRMLVKEFHPDTQSGTSEFIKKIADEKMAEISVAWGIIKKARKWK